MVAPTPPTTPPAAPGENLTNLGFGTLNDIGKPIGGNRQRQDSSQTFMDAVVGAADSQYGLNAIDNTGPYKAVVLRIVTPGGADAAPIAGGWLWGTGMPDPPVLVRVKARIPEIHAALPIPESLTPGEGPHQRIIDMYPTFVAQTTDLTPDGVAVGDIVYVDFGNKNKWTDPILVRYLKGTKQGAGGGAGSGECFRPTSGGGGLSPPPGDALPGSNKAAANSGLPLLPRKAASVESGEFKLIEGEKGAFVNTKSAWGKAIEAAKLPGKFWLGSLGGNEEDDSHKSEAKVRDTIIFAPNATDVSFKDAKVEVIVYFHDFNEYDGKSFTEIANTIKQMAVAGRNFVLVMPELPWSSNTTTPNGRTDEGIDDYNEWYDNVMETLSTITGGKFEDGSESLYVSVIAKNAGAYVIRNSSDSDEFHGTGGMSSDAAQRIIMSIPKGAGGDVVPIDFDELIDEWQAEINPNDTECAFLCHTSMKAQIEAEIQDLKNDLKTENRDNVILQEVQDSTPITAAALLTWVNVEKAKANEKKEIDAKKEADKTPATDAEAEKADMEQKPAETNPENPAPQPDAQAPPPKDPPTPPSETPKKSATDPKDAPSVTPGVPYEENRVRVKHYGGALIGAAAEGLLVDIPAEWTTGSKTRKLHKLAFNRVKALHDAAAEAGLKMFVASAWRKHKWKSYEDYKKKVTAEYGGGPEGWKKGKEMRAFNSPHETGLATDWGKPSGLEPESETISTQKKTPAFAWLKENAHLFGLTPYKKEPWHWEIKLTKEAFITGEEFVNVGEIPASYNVRVDNLGTTDAQLPSGPGSGGTGGGSGGGGGGASCRRRSGGGGGGGPYPSSGPGAVFDNVGSPGKVTIIPGPAMPARRHANGKGWPPRKLPLKLYVAHETAGWPTPTGAAYAKKMGLNNPKSRYHADADAKDPSYCLDWKAAGYAKKPEECKSKANSFVTYWTAHNGEIIQTGPFTSLCWSAGPVNGFSQGNEVGNRVRIKFKKGGHRGSDSVKKASHVLIRQDAEGHVRVLPGYEGGGTYRGEADECYMLASQAQWEAVWNHFVWIASGADGIEGSEVIQMALAFPAVMSDDYFCWGRTPLGLGGGKKAFGEWWKAQGKSDDWKGGLAAHNNWWHADGALGEYYCLARAMGFSADEAYYCAVGALCSMAGKGKNHTGHGKKCTRHPDKEYTQMGRDIMKGAPLTAKYNSFTGDEYWGW